MTMYEWLFTALFIIVIYHGIDTAFLRHDFNKQVAAFEERIITLEVRANAVNEGAEVAGDAIIRSVESLSARIARIESMVGDA